jgi:hypothetical protein
MNYGIKDTVDIALKPLYGWIKEYGLLILILIIIAIELRVIAKAIQAKKAKKWSKVAYGNTNEWFSIENPKTEQNSQLPI